MRALLLAIWLRADPHVLAEAFGIAKEEGAFPDARAPSSFLRARAGLTRAPTACSKSNLSSAETHQIFAVVNNFHHKEDTDWLTKAHIAFEEVGTCLDGQMTEVEASLCGRRISEAYPWLQWIVQHHGHIQTPYVAFLHGHENAWHSPSDGYLCHLLTAPKSVQMLSDGACDWGDKPPGWHRHVGFSMEPALDIIYQALYASDFVPIWNASMDDYRCCSEMIVNTDSINKVDKRVFEAVLSLMAKCPEQPWGWIMEFSWQNLFSKNIARPVEEVETILANATLTHEQVPSPNEYYYDWDYWEEKGLPCECTSCSDWCCWVR